MKQHRRLLRSMRIAACLSQTEAECALRNWVSNRDEWSGEAANHFGGFIQLVLSARRSHSRRVKLDSQFPANSKYSTIQDALTAIFTGPTKLNRGNE